jgi:hypothetical protein
MGRPEVLEKKESIIKGLDKGRLQSKQDKVINMPYYDSIAACSRIISMLISELTPLTS